MGDPERPHRLRPLPGRLQRRRDDARGQGQANPLAQPPRGGRGLDLRQGQVRLSGVARRRPRDLAAPPHRRPALRGGLLGRGARRGRAARARGRRRHRPGASGTETVEIAYTLSRFVREGLGAHTVVLPEQASPRWPATGSRSRRSATRTRSSSSATTPSSNARRSSTSGSAPHDGAAAKVVTVGPAGRVQTKPGAYTRLEKKIAEGARRREAGGDRLVGARRTGRRRAGRAGPRARRGCPRRLPPPVDAERPRRSRTRGTRPATERSKPERIGLLIVSGDEIARDARLRELAGKADAVVAIGMFAEELRRVRRRRPAGDELPRARRDDGQPRGSRAAPPPRGDAALPRRARLGRQTGRAVRRHDRPRGARRVRRALAEALPGRRAGGARRVRPRGGRTGAAEGEGRAEDQSGRRRATPADELPRAVLGPAGRARARAPLPAAASTSSRSPPRTRPSAASRTATSSA